MNVLKSQISLSCMAEKNSNCSCVFSTGSHANLFYADAPKPQLEVLTDAFWDYVAKATQTADETLQMIRKSQFGQEVK